MKKYFTIILTITFCFVLSKGSYAQELKTEEIAEVNIPLDPTNYSGNENNIPY